MKFLTVLASSLLIGLTSAAIPTSVFAQVTSATLEQSLDLVDGETTPTMNEPLVFELQQQQQQQSESATIAPGIDLTTDAINRSNRVSSGSEVAPLEVVPFVDTGETEPTPATTDSVTSQEPPLVSIDSPLVAGGDEPTQTEPEPITVFVATANVRSVGGSTVLEITPERQSITLQPSAADRMAAWQAQIRNALIQSVPMDGYQGVPAPPPAGTPGFVVEPGALPVAAANLDRNYLETLFPVPTQPTDNPTDGSIRSMVYPLGRVVPITSNFGWRSHPIYGDRRFHAGIDFGAPYGTPVLAVLPGQVVAVGSAGGYGLRIVLQHGNQTQTLYAHLSQALVQVGDVVQPGQVIGRVGTSGNVTGPHLHLELLQQTAKGWQAIDFRAQLDIAAANRQNRVGSVPAALQQPDANAPIVRVAIGKRLKTVQLASSTPAWVLDAHQRPITILPGMQSFVAAPSRTGIKVGATLLPTVFFLQPSNNGAVAVNGKWYRGRLLIASLPHGLVVVNWVDIESYLYSVVGGESYPSWGQEALKAQAIAARTYALKIRKDEPASAWFDLDDTPRYQRYRGIETEFPSTIQAVLATQRQILVDSRYGNLILSQYAATQDLVNAVHRGYGLSQWGAASLANQGFEYRQILRHYYPGTVLTVIGIQSFQAVRQVRTPVIVPSCCIGTTELCKTGSTSVNERILNVHLKIEKNCKKH